jgi:hypothetical protein
MASPYTWFHPKRSSSHHHIILMVPWSHASSLILHVIVPSFDLKHLFYSSMSHHIRISIIWYQTSSSILPNIVSNFYFQCPSYLVIHAWLASLGPSQALGQVKPWLASHNSTCVITWNIPLVSQLLIAPRHQCTQVFVAHSKNAPWFPATPIPLYATSQTLSPKSTDTPTYLVSSKLLSQLNCHL